MRELSMNEIVSVSGGAEPPIGQKTFGGYWSACMAYTSPPASVNTALAIGSIFSPVVAAASAFIALAPAGVCALAGVQTLQ